MGKHYLMMGYELIRAEVAGLARTHPAAAARVSYAALHTLAGTNACGFTTRFPHYQYYPLDKKARVSPFLANRAFGPFS